MSGELIKCVRKYRALDDELKELNSKTYKLREDRKIVELEMSDILKSTNYATIHKLEIKDDNSVIKIQRPDMWSKPWSLSVKDLKMYLDEYWAKPGPKNADDCLKYIVDERKKNLVATEFAFTRNKLVLDSEDANV